MPTPSLLRLLVRRSWRSCSIIQQSWHPVHCCKLAFLQVMYSLIFVTWHIVPLLLQLGWRPYHFVGFYPYFNDISVQKLKDVQIIQKDMLQQFERVRLCGKYFENTHCNVFASSFLLLYECWCGGIVRWEHLESLTHSKPQLTPYVKWPQ